MPKQNTAPADFPQAVIQQIEELAQNIVTARKRRKETQAQWAGRLGVSQPTMARIERGDPSVAMASYVMCMWLVNQAHGLADLIAPQNDHASLEQEVARTRSRPKAASGAAAKKIKTEGSRSGGRKMTVPQPVVNENPIYKDVTSRVAAENLGGDPDSALEKALRNAGLGMPGANPNASAAGLAALMSGSKKSRP